MTFNVRELLRIMPFLGLLADYFDVGGFDDETVRKNTRTYATQKTITASAE